MSSSDYYALDGALQLGVFSSAGTLVHWNIVAGGRVVGRYEGGARKYYHMDHLGTTRSVVEGNCTGSCTIREAKDYDPWGIELDGRSYLSGNAAIEGFTSKERDAETGLDYFGARYYLPSVGRWNAVDPMAEDPMQLGLSPYNYVLNNPISITDPDGKCPWCIGGLVGGIVDAVSQVTLSMSSGASFSEASSEIDWVDVGISAAAGAVSGGLSLLKNASTAVRIGGAVAANVGEGAAKAHMDPDKQYSMGELLLDASVGAVSGGAGAIAENIASSTKKGTRMSGVLNRMEDRYGRAKSATNGRNMKSAKGAVQNYLTTFGSSSSGGVDFIGDQAKQGLFITSAGNSFGITVSNSGSSVARSDNTNVVANFPK